MSYRSADAAVQERIEGVERDMADLDERIRTTTEELMRIEKESAHLRERIELAGPGGGHTGVALLRTPVLLQVLFGFGVLVLPVQIYIAGYVHAVPDETVIPLLIVGAPALLGLVIAWSYREVDASARRHVLMNAVLLGGLLMLLALGFAGVLRS